MSRQGDRIVSVFVREAESRGACVEQEIHQFKPIFERRVKAGELVSPLPRMYADAKTWASLNEGDRHLFKMRALHELHPDWVFCGISAAVAHGLSVSYSLIGKPAVSTSSGRGSLHAGTVRGTQVRGDSVTEAAGLPVTSLERTVFDCLRTVGFEDGTAIADSALSRGVGKRELITYIESLRGRFRTHDVEKALDVARFADARSESGGESIARATMYELGFAAPELQAEFADPVSGRIYRADFKWSLEDGQIILGELDGGEKYTNPSMTGGRRTIDVMRRERLRESRLTAGHASVMRFSPADVKNTAYFDRLLTTFGVPRDHEPLVAPPDQAPIVSDEVPLEAYGLD